MQEIIVIGHENSDTDSVCSAIALAELLKAEGKEAGAFRKGCLNKETAFALKTARAEQKIKEIKKVEVGREFFLVDFNEKAQSPVDVASGRLIGLIDHHKVALEFKTEEPTYLRFEPLGSSSTIVAKIYTEKKIEMTGQVAKLLLCGIISDTLNLTSPTTTEEDKNWVKKLARLTKLKVSNLADKLFEAKSDLSDFSPRQIVKLDYKNFDFGGKKVGIGVVETVKPEKVKKLEKALKKALTEIKKQEKLDLIYLGVVDILRNRTEMFLIGAEEKALIMKVFSDIVIDGENLVLRGVVSRKKQIVPVMEKGFK